MEKENVVMNLLRKLLFVFIEKALKFADLLSAGDSTIIGEWEYNVYHPNCKISTNLVKFCAKVDGWDIAMPEHLVAFNEVFPKDQNMCPVVALGLEHNSIVDYGGGGHRIHRREVFFRFSDGGLEWTNVYWWYDSWPSHIGFLRVRKVQTSKI